MNASEPEALVVLVLLIACEGLRQACAGARSVASVAADVVRWPRGAVWGLVLGAVSWAAGGRR